MATGDGNGGGGGADGTGGGGDSVQATVTALTTAPLRFMSDALKAVVTAQATGPQAVLFALVVFCILGVVGLAAIAAGIEWAPVVIIIAILAGVMVVLMVVNLLATRPPAPPPTTGVPADVLAQLARLQAAVAAAEAELKEARAEVGKREAALNDLRELRRTYLKAMAAISTHYRKTDDRFPEIRAIRTVVTLDGAGGVEVAERWEIRGAAGRPQHFLLFDHTGSSAVDSFARLRYAIQPHSAHKVATLPGEGTTSTQDVLLMFLPPLAHDDPITFTCSWAWPGVFAPLVREKTDLYRQGIRSAGPVPLVRVVFHVPTESPIPFLRLADEGTHPGHQVTDVPPQDQRPNYRTYVWEARDVPDKKDVAVRLTWA